MKPYRFLISLFLSIMVASPLSAQNVVLSGLVTDAQTGEPLVGVTVYNTQRRTGTTTNSVGSYTITLPSGRPLELVFSYVGYASETQTLTLTRDTKLDVKLRQDTQNLSEVQVYGTRHNFGVQSSQMSAIAVSADQIRKMPTLLGEADVLKSLQRLPGVQSSGEGRAGIHVRGGENDQNLFSIDGITLYNPEHLQGFTSAMNADVMDDVVLYKGAFPARYGSRLSSVVDVSLREGDSERHRVSVTAGMLASRLQAEGPLWKGHTSYNIAARVSYFNAIVSPLLKEVVYDNPGQMDNYSHMRYYDVNALLTHRFTEKDRLSATFYLGHDTNRSTPTETAQHFEYSKTDPMTNRRRNSFIDNGSESRRSNSWNNLLAGVDFSHEFGPSLRLEAGAGYSGYDYRLEYTDSSSSHVGVDLFNEGAVAAQTLSQRITDGGTRYGSRVNEFSGRIDFNYKSDDRHDAHFGIEASAISLKPEVETYSSVYQKSAVNEESVWNVTLGDDRYRISEESHANLLAGKGNVMSFAAYAEDDWTINRMLKANLGLRLQGYNADGKTHLLVEPRITARLMVVDGLSVKASYARMSQGVFLLSSGNLVTPSEVWIPLNKEMRPGISDQVSAGLGYQLRNGIELSVEGYYKWLDNVVEYQEGASYMIQQDWNRVIALGKGRAYGIEFLARKALGTTRGHISYTWSKSLRTFDCPGMELNGGLEFFAAGDRRHNFNVSITQRISKNWDLSASWTFQSGRRADFATTTMSGALPDEFNNYVPAGSTAGAKDLDLSQNHAFSDIARYYDADTDITRLVRMTTYKQRNGYVLPAVHRLDLNLSHHGSIGIGEMICDIGIYNVYNQQNVSTVYWAFENNRRTLKGVCMFPIMPSISLTL
ncbi:MAG: TonB-dependent receptor, partial [Bacteroidaceae bacterium]|nr:TonB-dependent receptor [Bacteroidaceae bacterium]